MRGTIKLKQSEQQSIAKVKPKVCFVIMPIADMDGYDTGHFDRVYSHLIKPACELAGYQAVRADDVASSNYIIIDILHKILDSEMVLCDLSGRNPNVLYELGIRQAFNLPTVLIKDIKTNKIFDIQGLRYTEYNQSLRVDEVSRDANLIKICLEATAKPSSTDVNSLIQLLAVKPATRPSSVELSSETSVILSAIKDLANRISKVETFKSTGNRNVNEWLALREMRSINKDKIFIDKFKHSGADYINGEPAEIGDSLFIDGKEIGVLADISASSILVKTKDDTVVKFSISDPNYKLISTSPF